MVLSEKVRPRAMLSKNQFDLLLAKYNPYIIFISNFREHERASEKGSERNVTSTVQIDECGEQEIFLLLIQRGPCTMK